MDSFQPTLKATLVTDFERSKKWMSNKKNAISRMGFSRRSQSLGVSQYHFQKVSTKPRWVIRSSALLFIRPSVFAVLAIVRMNSLLDPRYQTRYHSSQVFIEIPPAR